MFTGIIQGIVPIIKIEEKKHFRTHYICLPKPLLGDVAVGASMAHNGCCLTVTSVVNDLLSFDIIKETLNLTNLGELIVGDEINLERAPTLQTEIGGHLMSGHIICTAVITKIVDSENNRQIWFRLSKLDIMKFILYKGYIGIDGISLTVGEVVGNQFCAHLIPETLIRTTLGKKRIGDYVNIEIDSQIQAIVQTVERILADREDI
ncbi:riboflavin synthase alpha chain [secondary endosymbiont of Heteropsylla cubana]|uniref:Riboflavin synthase n=1 Tax=secondary endosymbiont of Heteropsylla cubana TaxID=134287 RepID=J3TGT0_9ENTR|nr:riboflavin synthase [secondary endosymbiont of Heteropsylla cubana]AFP85717.1 riboflavin synthase alpha chain [secondary endosymbiont of Heteropsylla cubana]